jgi:hypothetical protein
MNGMKSRKRLDECLWYAFLTEKCVYVQRQVAKRKHGCWGHIPGDSTQETNVGINPFHSHSSAKR